MASVPGSICIRFHSRFQLDVLVCYVAGWQWRLQHRSMGWEWEWWMDAEISQKQEEIAPWNLNVAIISLFSYRIKKNVSGKTINYVLYTIFNNFLLFLHTSITSQQQQYHQHHHHYLTTKFCLIFSWRIKY